MSVIYIFCSFFFFFQIIIPKHIISNKHNAIESPNSTLNITLSQKNNTKVISNLQNKTFIYGNITKQAYQAFIIDLKKNYNVSTCPQTFPFAQDFNYCINCDQQLYIWDVETSKCTKCLNTQKYNETIHQCTQYSGKKYNSNKIAKNYIGLATNFDPKNQNCTEEKPYSNITQCLKCQLPMVFNYQTLKCQNCRQGGIFNLNIESCVVVLVNYTTNFDTVNNWIISKNLTNFYEEIQMQKYNTKKCQNEKYFDNITCVPCYEPQIFDLDTLRCIDIPSTKVFNPNIHKLVDKRNQTYNSYPDNTNVIVKDPSKLPPDNSTSPNMCNKSQPHYDGVSCIACSKPNYLFDYDQRLCTKCPNDTIYDQSIYSCQKNRTINYTNFNSSKILTSGKLNFSEHRQKQNSIINKTIYGINICPVTEPFSNGSACISCNDTDALFNIETRKCDKCSLGHTFNQLIHNCTKDIYILNISANNILLPQNYTLETLQSYIANITASNPNSKIIVCPQDKPYQLNNQCIACNQNNSFYNIRDGKCQNCSNGTTYNRTVKKCISDIYVTNINASNILLPENTTLDNITTQIQKIRKDNPSSKIIVCPLEKPFLIKQCTACNTSQPLFNYIKKICQPCQQGKSYNQIKRLCTQNIYVQSLEVQNLIIPNNQSLNNLKQVIANRIKNNINGTKILNCSTDKPFLAEKCLMCNNSEPYFNIQTKKCENCRINTTYSSSDKQCVQSNITHNLQINKNWITNGSIEQKINYQKVHQLRTCNNTGQYYNGKSCIVCNQTKIFDLDTLRCIDIPSTKVFNPNIHKLVDKRNQTYNSYPDNTNVIVKDPSKLPPDNSTSPNMCNKSQPHYDGVSCIACSKPNYLFDYDQRLCTKCPNDTIYDQSIYSCQKNRTINYTNFNSSKILTSGKLNFSEHRQKQNSIINKTIYGINICPVTEPFSNGSACISCNDTDALFNIETRKCDKCSLGHTFNQLIHNCTKDIYILNISANNILLPQNYTLETLQSYIANITASNPNSKIIVCPQDKPYQLNNQCIACNQNNSFYNIRDGKCQNCSNGTTYNRTVKKCISDIYVTNINASNILLPENTTLDNITTQIQKIRKDNPSSKIIVCPLEKPFLIKQCTTCNDSLPLFNFTQKLCQKCQQGKSYNKTIRLCTQNIYVTNPAAKNLLVLNNQSQSFYIQQEQNLRKKYINNNITVCSLQTPYFTGKSCQKCPNQTKLFNHSSLSCTKCPPNETYFQNIKRCTKNIYITNINSSFLASQQQLNQFKKNITQVIKNNPNNLVVSCQMNNPYYNDSCIQCSGQNNLFSLINKKCVKCEGDNQQYDIVSKQCKNYTHITSPNAPNLFFLGQNLNSYWKIYNKTIQSTPNAKSCPQLIPYYNGKKCISCPKNTPLFNIEMALCLKCNEGTQYHSDLRACVNRMHSDRTRVQRLIMNII